MISLSVQVEFTVGLRRTAQMSAFAMMSSGEIRTPAKSGEALSRLTNSIVRLASMSTNTLTCGAVNALCTIAAAIAFRTPFTGMRSSRPFPTRASGCCRNTLACGATPDDVVPRDLAGEPGRAHRRRGRR